MCLQVSIPSRVAREAVNADELRLQVNAAYIAGLPQVRRVLSDSCIAAAAWCTALSMGAGEVCIIWSVSDHHHHTLDDIHHVQAGFQHHSPTGTRLTVTWLPSRTNALPA
jgi:pyocin large subunit-like protein